MGSGRGGHDRAAFRPRWCHVRINRLGLAPTGGLNGRPLLGRVWSDFYPLKTRKDVLWFHTARACEAKVAMLQRLDEGLQLNPESPKRVLQTLRPCRVRLSAPAMRSPSTARVAETFTPDLAPDGSFRVDSRESALLPRPQTTRL